MQTTYDAITKITLVFALVFALSFVIERILEILKAAYDMIDSRYDFHRYWTARARSTASYVERRLRIFEYVDEKAASAFLQRFSGMLLGPADGYTGTLPILSGDLVRAVWVRVALKVLGCAIGVAFAFALGLDVIAIGSANNALHGLSLSSGPGKFATGIVMGLGSGIAHKIITKLESKQNTTPEAAHG